MKSTMFSEFSGTGKGTGKRGGKPSKKGFLAGALGLPSRFMKAFRGAIKGRRK